MMKVTIFGAGYVGLVTGACLAEVGHSVVCVDTDSEKVAGLGRGVVPIFEPSLTEMILRNRDAGRLQFTVDAPAAVAHGDVHFIAVGTPPGEDGNADIRQVLAVADTIGRHLARPGIIVDKSTVPVGTADRVAVVVAQAIAARNAQVGFDVVSNPEFLKEGDAIRDCLKPDRIVIGSSSPDAIETMKRLYAPFNRSHERLVIMDVRSAELTKYAANAMLATKISFMNEIANIAECVGADVEMVRLGIGSDSRIGYSFIYPGAGYGGSCFPKDVQALGRSAAEHGYQARLLDAVEAVNKSQKSRLFQLAARHFGGRLTGKVFALWGLAFKPNTDDVREAPSRVLVTELLAAGAQVRAFDPEAAAGEFLAIAGAAQGLTLCSNQDEALLGADALVVVTEWKQFRNPDFEAIRARLRSAVVFDGRNIFEPAQVEAAGLAYYGIGRGRSVASLSTGRVP